MAPHGDPEAASGFEHAVGLGDGVRRRPPDAAKAGDDIEGRVVPREGVHVADPEVGFGEAVLGHCDQSWRRVDAGARRAPDTRQLDGESGAAGHVQHAVTGADTQLLVQGHVLAAVRRLAQRGEVDGAPAPSLVDDAPILRTVRVSGRRRHGVSSWSWGRREPHAPAAPPTQRRVGVDVTPSIVAPSR